MSSRPRLALQIGLPFLVLAAGFGLMSFLASLHRDPAVTPPETVDPVVVTTAVTEEPVPLWVDAQGTAEPRTETTLASEVAGRVLSVSPALADGGFFDAGEVLLQLDDTDLVLAREEARGRVAQAQLLLAQEEADADVARRDWASLHEGEPPPLVAHAPQLAHARAELAAARAAETKAERDVARARIVAPYPGRVMKRMVDVASYVQPGQELARVYATDFAEVRLPVPDRELALLDLPLNGAPEVDGPPVTLSADFAGARRTWQGRIVRTEGALDPMSRMVVLVAAVEDPYGRNAEHADGVPLLAGQFVDAHIQGRTLPSAVVLPREAVRTEDRVFLLDDRDHLDIRPVTVVDADDSRAVVTGLSKDARVIVSGLELPVEGMRLREEGNATSSPGVADTHPVAAATTARVADK